MAFCKWEAQSSFRIHSNMPILPSSSAEGRKGKKKTQQAKDHSCFRSTKTLGQFIISVDWLTKVALEHSHFKTWIEYTFTAKVRCQALKRGKHFTQFLLTVVLQGQHCIFAFAVCILLQFSLWFQKASPRVLPNVSSVLYYLTVIVMYPLKCINDALYQQGLKLPFIFKCFTTHCRIFSVAIFAFKFGHHVCSINFSVHM